MVAPNSPEKQMLKKITDDRLISSIVQIRQAAEDIWSFDSPRLVQSFTDHGIKHSERLIGHAAKLLEANEGKPLSSPEIYLLLASIYLHDIGMQSDIIKFPEIKNMAEKIGARFDVDFKARVCEEYSIDERKSIRNNHHYLTAAWIEYAYKNGKTVLGLAAKTIPDIFISDLIDICKYHSKFSIEECPQTFSFDKTQRKQLIAVLLRLSDELDIDRMRVSLETIRNFSFDDRNFIYWWMHERTQITYISNNIININIRLHPIDKMQYGPIIYALFIKSFQTKNQASLNLLRHYNIPIAINAESGIVEDDFAEHMPNEVIEALKRLVNNSESMLALAEDLSSIYWEGKREKTSAIHSSNGIFHLLEREKKEFSEFAKNSDTVKILSSQGNPPMRYLISFMSDGVIGIDKNENPIIANNHLAEILIHDYYPLNLPFIRFLTPVFHPNVYPTGQVCLGWSSLPCNLIDICIHLTEMISYKSLNLNCPANTNAAHWARKFSNKFPISKWSFSNRVNDKNEIIAGISPSKCLHLVNKEKKKTNESDTQEQKSKESDKKTKSVQGMKVLVCLLSSQHIANLLAVKTIKPDLLILVVAPIMKGKESHLMKALAVGGLDYSLKHEIIELNEENSIDEVYDVLQNAFVSYSEDKWIINLTGGTKAMVIGAYEFSKNNGLKTLQIAEGGQCQAIDLLGGPSLDLIHNISMAELLAGQGFDILNLRSIERSEDRLRSWIDLAALLAKHNQSANLRGFLGKLQKIKEYKIMLERNDWYKNGLILEEKDDAFLEDDTLRTVIASQFGLSSSGSIITGRLEGHAVEFITGKWLDVFIWSLLLPFVNQGISDLHIGAIVGLEDSGVNNYLDVSFMKNQSLCIVECKTGEQKHDPGAIYALDKTDAIKLGMKALRIETYLATTSDNIVDPNTGKIKENLQRRSMILGCKIIPGWTIRNMADLYLLKDTHLLHEVADLFGIKTENL